MISVSEAYKELVKSNIRPKCEPQITVSGIDNNGNQTAITWNAKDIKDLSFRRGIDPVGRELPYIELTWKEIYSGKFNEQNYPEKYNNIAKYMRVDLSFVQNLSFYNTWKLIFQSGTKWSDLKNYTWKEVKNNVLKETINFPTLFLTAKPVIEGQTITWTARDLMYFLTEKQIKSFDKDINFVNPLRYFVLNERGNFKSSEDVFWSLHKTDQMLKEFGDEKGWVFDKKIIFDNSTNSLMMNYISLKNGYFDFKEDYIYPFFADDLKKFESEPQECVYSSTMYKEPVVKNGTNMSMYSFKSYQNKENKDAIYKVTDPEYVFIGKDKDGNDVYAGRFDFGGYGVLNIPSSAFSEINYAIAPYADTIDVIPIYSVGVENIKSTGKTGEVFNEDNKLNPYSIRNKNALARYNFLNNYFSEKNSTIEINCLPNMSIETGDYIGVETNFYDVNGVRVVKNGIVVQEEITYNGSARQRLVVKEHNWG
jgi:hypothetical protein